MKKLLLIILIFFCVKSYSQPTTDTSKWIGASGSFYAYSGSTSNYSSVFRTPTYPEKDTLQCHFLEVVNDSSFLWRSGFVIRHKGFIDFGKTSVQQNYLPVTSGVVTSPLFYSDGSPIKTYAIQVAIKPVSKKETTVIGL